jgi:Ca2+-binding EF-hand superfamily protein
MQYLKLFLVVVFLAVSACAGAPPAPSSGDASLTRSEFRALCRALGAEDGKLSREQFIAQAKDKKAAAELFDACDTKKKGYLTEEDVRPDYLQNLKQQVIRLTEPGFRR